MPTRLLLIRHGQTNCNAKKRYSGFTDVSLNSTGRQQAAKLKSKIPQDSIHRVYSSDRKRARQTARIIFGKRRVEIIPELREMHFGVFEGLTYKEIMTHYPDMYQKWLADPFSLAIPKGDDLRDFQKRVVRAFKKIAAGNHNKTVAIVSHGGAISVFLNYIRKSRDFWNQIPHSASLSIVDCKNHKARVKSFDDTSHLHE